MFHAFDMVAGLPDTARWALVVMFAGMELVSAAKNTAKLGHGKLADALEGLYLALMRSNPALKKVEQATVDKKSEDKSSDDSSATEGSKPNEQVRAENQSE